jgi:glycerol-3-phosphate acyltransferase PlsY
MIDALLASAAIGPAGWWLFALAGFVSGSIPFGLILGRARGIDIRDHGSGNIGATNVARVLGWKIGLLAFVLDVAKGLVPVALAGIVMDTFGKPVVPTHDALAWLGVMTTPVLGHCFSPFLKFKGGKGVATGLGALVAVAPAMSLAGLVGLCVFILVLRLTRYVSVSSIVAALSIPMSVATYYSLAWQMNALTVPVEMPTGGGQMRVVNVSVHPLSAGWPFIAAGVALVLLVVFTHRANIGRLLKGTENRFSLSKKPAATGDPAPAGDPATPGRTG